MTEKTRASKTGLGHVVEKKMEQNTDGAVQDGTLCAIANWINGTMEGEDDFKDFQKIPPLTGGEDDWKIVAEALKNGGNLCLFINKLLKDAGKSQVKVQAKATAVFQCLNNIENFNTGVTNYGLPKESTFQSGDLWELRKGPFFNVINCLHSLGFVANNNNCKCKYEGNLKKND